MRIGTIIDASSGARAVILGKVPVPTALPSTTSVTSAYRTCQDPYFLVLGPPQRVSAWPRNSCRCHATFPHSLMGVQTVSRRKRLHSTPLRIHKVLSTNKANTHRWPHTAIMVWPLLGTTAGPYATSTPVALLGLISSISPAGLLISETNWRALGSHPFSHGL